MKKLLITIALTSVLFSCKKETTTPTTNNNSNSDTTTNSSSSASVQAIDCSSALVLGTLKKGVSASSVTVMLDYSSGNGKSFSAQTISSTGVVGLTAKLEPGVLNNGEGQLVYIISGTPTSAGKAVFKVTMGTASCSFSADVQDVNQTGIKAGENIIDVDGNSYKTVIIGTQTWMAENLRVTKFNDGTPIPLAIDKSAWVNADVPARCYYDNNISNAKYGALYNWSVIGVYNVNSKNVCPTGWHVSRDIDWSDLVNYLGGEEVAGGKLKEAGMTNWEAPNTDASNSSLFTALPGGLRTTDGDFYWIKNRGYWWTATEQNAPDARYRYIKFDSGMINWSFDYKRMGMSIRCVKD
jgi:uncharacterized protein (TIGR02145 family)